MISWDLWQSMFELSQTGSYKAAAARLGVNQTTMRRRREILENRLGRHLFVKEDGRLKPTPACQSALQEIEAAAEHISAARMRLGHDAENLAWRKVTITSVPYVCDRLLGPALSRLPDRRRLRIELVGEDRNLEVSGGRDADIALRLGGTRDDSLAAWHVADIVYSTYAARSGSPDAKPWITLDRSHSHLDEVRVAEKFAGAEGVRFTASSTICMLGVIETGAAKGLLPNFIGSQMPNLTLLRSHPTISRPVWLMWREEISEDPYFLAILKWVVQETVTALQPTSEAEELLRFVDR